MQHRYSFMSILFMITALALFLDTKVSAIDPSPEEETRALSTADYLLSGGHAKEYRQLRSQWISREQLPHQWLFFDSEELFLSGDREGAIALLEQHTLIGKEETDRLVRLAALYVVESPAQAWQCLNSACLKDPHNPDLHIFKATLLESYGKKEDAAREYIAAMNKNPKNNFIKEELASFYIRTGQHSQALQLLKEEMKNNNASAGMWLQAFFLDRVTNQDDLFTNTQFIPAGPLKPAVVYAFSLPKDQLWDTEKGSALLTETPALNERQEIFWLQLIDALKQKNETLAQNILDNQSFKEASWAPEIEAALKNTLAYRRQFLQNAPSLVESPSIPFDQNALNDQKLFLSTLAMGTPPELHDILIHENALALPFLASEWNRAALHVATIEQMPSFFPKWATCCWGEALASNEGAQKALSFISRHPSSNHSQLLMARLLIQTKEERNAMSILRSLYTEKNEIGAKATLLIAPLLLTEKSPKAVQEAILNQPLLVNDVTARELLARSFFQEGNLDTAFRLYSSLESLSIEAKSFLAQKAFADKDWKRARQLTVELLTIYPDSQALQNNLKMLSMR